MFHHMQEYIFDQKHFQHRKNPNNGSTTSYYSDFFYVGSAFGQKYILAYGGTWDNSSASGIFTIRAFETVSSRKNANGSRIMKK